MDQQMNSTHTYTTHLVAHIAERQAFFAARARTERAALLAAIAEGRSEDDVEDLLTAYGQSKKDLGFFEGLYAATGKAEGYDAISTDAYNFILAAANGEYETE